MEYDLAHTLAGLSLSMAGAGLPHPLGEVLASLVPEISHGISLAVFYPSYIRFLIEENNLQFKTLATALGYHDSQGLEAAILSFMESIGMKLSLSDISISGETIEALIQIMEKISYGGIPMDKVRNVILEAR